MISIAISKALSVYKKHYSPTIEKFLRLSHRSKNHRGRQEKEDNAGKDYQGEQRHKEKLLR